MENSLTRIFFASASICSEVVSGRAMAGSFAALGDFPFSVGIAGAIDSVY
jgi:hypothetical protein